MSRERALWEVTRLAFGRPYRVHMGEQEDRLKALVLDFCRTPRSIAEIESELREKTDCPHDRTQGLALTVETALFANKGGRLLDNNFLTWKRGDGPVKNQATELGLKWLAERTEVKDGAHKE